MFIEKNRKNDLFIYIRRIGVSWFLEICRIGVPVSRIGETQCKTIHLCRLGSAQDQLEFT